MNMTYIFISIIAYLIGSIPFAYIIIKLLLGKDIRDEGSGNVGAMNTFEISWSKIYGFIVLILDFLKAYACIYFVDQYTTDTMLIRLVAAFIVLGHNYSIFLGFSGGRGLAPAAGAFAYINPFGIIMWFIMYYTSKLVINKDVHISIAVGLIGANIMLWATPIELLKLFQNVDIPDINEFRTLYILISLFIISKLIKPIKEHLGIKDEEIN